jgi:hypothetical protein
MNRAFGFGIMIVCAVATLSGCDRGDDQKQQKSQSGQRDKQPQTPSAPAFAGKSTADWLGVVNDPKAETRLEAAHALRAIGAAEKEKTLPALRAMLTDNCSAVRIEAVEGVLVVDPSADKAELARSSAELLDGTRADQTWAVGMLQSLGPAARAALPKLKETLESSSLDAFDREAVRKAIEAIEAP